MSGIYQFEFKKNVSAEGINDALNLSILNVRNIFGKPKVQLDGWTQFDSNKKIILIDKSTEVGQHIAQHFVSFITRSFGEDSFTITRLRKRKTFLTPSAASSNTQSRAIKSIEKNKGVKNEQ
jgi:hypothetical protein